MYTLVVYAALESQKAVSAYFKIVLFDFARQYNSIGLRPIDLLQKD